MSVSFNKTVVITAAAIGVLLLLVACPAMTQKDSSSVKNLQTGSVKATTAVVKPRWVPAFYSTVWPPVTTPYYSSKIPFATNSKTFYEYKQSKTIITIIGMGALTILGKKTNHAYQYPPHGTHP